MVSKLINQCNNLIQRGGASVLVGREDKVRVGGEERAQGGVDGGERTAGGGERTGWGRQGQWVVCIRW